MRPDFDRGGDGKRSCEKLSADIACRHELLDIDGIVDERNDVAHPPTHGSEHIPNILQNLAHLSMHLIGAHHLAISVERDLALQVNNLALALNDGHREGAERGPHALRIDSIDHRKTPRIANIETAQICPLSAADDATVSSAASAIMVIAARAGARVKIPRQADCDEWPGVQRGAADLGGGRDGGCRAMEAKYLGNIRWKGLFGVTPNPRNKFLAKVA
jgi:hypothetical protein